MQAKRFTDRQGRNITIRQFGAGNLIQLRAFDEALGPVPDGASLGTAGLVNLQVEHAPDGSKRTRLQDIIIPPAYRGAGISDELLGQALEVSRNNGSQQIYGSVENQQARDFWDHKQSQGQGWQVKNDQSYYGSVQMDLAGAQEEKINMPTNMSLKRENWQNIHDVRRLTEIQLLENDLAASEGRDPFRVVSNSNTDPEYNKGKINIDPKLLVMESANGKEAQPEPYEALKSYFEQTQKLTGKTDDENYVLDRMDALYNQPGQVDQNYYWNQRPLIEQELQDKKRGIVKNTDPGPGSGGSGGSGGGAAGDEPTPEQLAEQQSTQLAEPVEPALSQEQTPEAESQAAAQPAQSADQQIQVQEPYQLEGQAAEPALSQEQTPEVESQSAAQPEQSADQQIQVQESYQLEGQAAEPAVSQEQTPEVESQAAAQPEQSADQQIQVQESYQLEGQAAEPAVSQEQTPEVESQAAAQPEQSADQQIQVQES
ncbi:MAG: GNAT family N-acetyltransferase, partial [Chloroflexota bacterium]